MYITEWCKFCFIWKRKSFYPFLNPFLTSLLSTRDVWTVNFKITCFAVYLKVCYSKTEYMIKLIKYVIFVSKTFYLIVIDTIYIVWCYERIIWRTLKHWHCFLDCTNLMFLRVGIITIEHDKCIWFKID